MKYHRRSNPHAAATAIQAAYRGYSVRRTHPLKHLRVIRKVRGELQKLEHEVATDPKVVEAIRRDPAERLRWSEGGMALLLQLDSMQGVHPAVREHRKALNKDVTRFQEYIDSAAAAAKGAHVPYVQSRLRPKTRASPPPPVLYHYCATGWKPHTPPVAAGPGHTHSENSYYPPPQRENSSYPPPPQEERNSYRPSHQENSSYRPSHQENHSYYPPQGPPPGTHQHSRTSSSSHGHPGVHPHAHMAYVPTVPGERPVGHFPPEPETTTYHPPQAPGPPQGTQQSSYSSYVNPHAHMAYVPTVPGERPVGHFPTEPETTHYPPQAAHHQYNGTAYSSASYPQAAVHPYAHMAYVPTVPGERPVGHFPVDPESTYPPPQAPGPPRATHQLHPPSTQAPVNIPYAHVPYVPTVPGDRRERPSEPERMYPYPPQRQGQAGWGQEQNYARDYR